MSGMTLNNQNAKKTLSGLELRNRSWSLIDKAHLDYSPKFIRSFKEGCAPFEAYDAIDGLIRTPMGYYRLAEDMRDGTHVLLHTYERSQLEGEFRGGKVRAPVLDDYDVYGITAHREARGAAFRDDMTHDLRYLENCFRKDLNLHAHEVELPADKNGHRRYAMKFANGLGGFSVNETADGKWRVRYFRNLRKEWDSASRFADVSDKEPWGGTIGRMFSIGKEAGVFDTHAEAFEYIRRAWRTSALQLFKGEQLLSEKPGFKERLVAGFLDFKEGKRHRDWAVAVFVGLSTGLASTLLTGGVSLLTALISVGLGAGWVFGGKAIENFINKRMINHYKKSDNQELELLKPHFEQNLIGNYLSKDNDNEDRMRRKIAPDQMSFLRLLNNEESNMNFNDGIFVPADNPMRFFESLSTASYRYFGALFDASHADKNLHAAIYPNGLVALTHMDDKTHTTRHYLTYRADYDEMGEIKKHLMLYLDDLPDDAPVHKITHRRGSDFTYTGMTEGEFMVDVMAKVGAEARDYRAFGIPLSGLFNVKAAKDIPPQEKHARAITPATAQKKKPMTATAA